MASHARGLDDDSDGESDVARHRLEIERWDRRRQAGWGFRTKHKNERVPAAHLRKLSRHWPLHRFRRTTGPVTTCHPTCEGSPLRPQLRLRHSASASERCQGDVEKTLRCPCLRLAGPSADRAPDRERLDWQDRDFSPAPHPPTPTFTTIPSLTLS